MVVEPGRPPHLNQARDPSCPLPSLPPFSLFPRDPALGHGFDDSQRPPRCPRGMADSLRAATAGTTCHIPTSLVAILSTITVSLREEPPQPRRLLKWLTPIGLIRRPTWPPVPGHPRHRGCPALNDKERPALSTPPPSAKPDVVLGRTVKGPLGCSMYGCIDNPPVGDGTCQAIANVYMSRHRWYMCFGTMELTR